MTKYEQIFNDVIKNIEAEQAKVKAMKPIKREKFQLNGKIVVRLESGVYRVWHELLQRTVYCDTKSQVIKVCNCQN